MRQVAISHPMLYLQLAHHAAAMVTTPVDWGTLVQDPELRAQAEVAFGILVAQFHVEPGLSWALAGVPAAVVVGLGGEEAAAATYLLRYFGGWSGLLQTVASTPTSALAKLLPADHMSMMDRRLCHLLLSALHDAHCRSSR